MIEVKEISFKDWDEFEQKINEFYPKLIFQEIAKLTEFGLGMGFNATIIFKK